MSKDKLLWLVVGVLLLVVVVGTVAWWKVETSCPPQSIKIKGGCAFPNSGQSAVPSGWKTYTNSQYGFELEYPADWKYDVNKNGTISFNPPDSNSQTDQSAQLSIFSFQSFSDLKKSYVSSDNNFLSFTIHHFWIEKPTIKNIKELSWTCGRVDGPGDRSECISQSKKGNILFLNFNTGDMLVENVTSTFKFTK